MSDTLRQGPDSGKTRLEEVLFSIYAGLGIYPRPGRVHGYGDGRV
ncbi:hypothetical protein ABEO75_18960 [Paenibacillus macerans]